MSKKEYMFDEVRKYIASEQSQLEFSLDKDYSYDSLKYWIKQYRLTGQQVPVFKSKSSFREVRFESNVENELRKTIELTTPSGLHLVIYE